MKLNMSRTAAWLLTGHSPRRHPATLGSQPQRIHVPLQLQRLPGQRFPPSTEHPCGSQVVHPE